MHKKNTSKDCDNRDNNNNNNDLLTDPLGGSSLLNYITVFIRLTALGAY